MLTLSFFFFSLFFLVGLGFHFFSFFILFLSFPFICLLSFDLSLLSKNSYLCLDSFSFLMIVLLIFMIIFCLISLEAYLWKLNYLFFLTFFFLFLSLFLFFVVSNLFFFFFFFECSLLPTLFLILGWGSNIERIQSGLYLFFYTLFSSLPMLFSIFFFLSFGFSLSFIYLSFLKFNVLYYFFVLSFLVKMPMFFVHSWLPKAHVEAPVYGSMILAGVLLKMGGYGIFRFFYFLKFFSEINLVWIYISVWGGVVSSMICIRQNDLKCLIAFSSVSHMSLVIIGLFLMNKISVLGSFYMMIGHGFCSSALFYMVNLIYLRSGTRNMILNKGLLSSFPSFSTWWFLFCVINMGCPPFLNLFGELFLMISSLSWSFSFLFLYMMISFLGAVYNLYMFSFTSHGNPNSNFLFFNPLLVREYLLIFLHFFPILFFFLKIDM